MAGIYQDIYTKDKKKSVFKPKIDSLSNPFVKPAEIINNNGRPVGSTKSPDVGTTDPNATFQIWNPNKNDAIGSDKNVDPSATFQIWNNEGNPNADFYNKNINSNPALKNAIESSYKRDAGGDQAKADEFISKQLAFFDAKMPVFNKLDDNAKQAYQSIVSSNNGDLGKNMLLDTYLKSKGIDITKLKTGTNTQAKFVPAATNTPTPTETQTTPTETQTTSNQNITNIADGINKSLEQTNTDLTRGLDELRIDTEKEKNIVKSLASKYGADLTQIDSYYTKQAEDYISGVKKNKTEMDGYFDNVMLNARNFNDQTLDLLKKNKEAALEAAQISGDKAIQEKTQYYNEIERTAKLQLLREKSNKVLQDKISMAIGNAEGTRFGTGTVKYYNDSVRQSDDILNSLEDKLLLNNNSKIEMLSTIRKEVNNNKEAIQNQYLSGTIASLKQYQDTLNNILIQKGKASQESLELINNAKTRLIEQLANNDDKRNNAMQTMTATLRSIDEYYNSNALSVANQQSENVLKAREMETNLYKYQNENNIKELETAKKISTETGVSSIVVDSIVAAKGGYKAVSEGDLEMLKSSIAELKNKGLTDSQIENKLGKQLNINSTELEKKFGFIALNEFYDSTAGKRISAQVNEGDVEGALATYENNILKNGTKIYGKGETTLLNINDVRATVEKFNILIKDLNKLDFTGLSGIPLNSLPASLQSDERIKYLQKVNAYIADYIRSISGTAASEREVDRLKSVLPNGSEDASGAKAKIDSFIEGYQIIVDAERSQFNLPKVNLNQINDPVYLSKVYGIIK